MDKNLPNLTEDFLFLHNYKLYKFLIENNLLTIIILMALLEHFTPKPTLPPVISCNIVNALIS